MQTRYLYKHIASDLEKKMVFIGGPRQVGKTTLSLNYLPTKTIDDPGYLTWDLTENRLAITKGQIPNQPVVVFDEIHKYTEWRNLIKGLYDTNKDYINFIVTGSARLDYFNQGGDSLQGRYHYYRLHPFSITEVTNQPNQDDLQQLLTYGGYPEPFTTADTRQWRRWHNERITRVINEDIKDLSNIRDISNLSLLIEELPNRVGSPLSIQKVSSLLKVSHATVSNWLDILEKMYISFRIAPFGSPKIRAVKKEQKLYLWDWSIIKDEGAKFENLVASQLLKYCHFQYDWQGYNMELRYIRDVDGREIDFVVLQDGMPLFAVECKLKDKDISNASKYFRERTNINKFFQVHLATKDYGNENTATRCLPFIKFCQLMQMP